MEALTMADGAENIPLSERIYFFNHTFHFCCGLQCILKLMAAQSLLDYTVPF